MNDIFWLKRANIGPLHVLIGRNDAIYARRSRASIHLNISDRRFVFFTLRIGTRFLNLDLV